MKKLICYMGKVEGQLRTMSALGRRRRTVLWMLLFLVLIAAYPCVLEAADVLILEPTVTSPAISSSEALEVIALGHNPVIVDNATWSAMTATQFASYRAIILGDPSCGGDGAIVAAVANVGIWGPQVDGNVIIIGTDPVFHKTIAESLIEKGIAFATDEPGKTGAYITLSCYYHFAPANTAVPLLDYLSNLGGFTVTGVNCFNDAHIVATHPALSGLTDGDLSNWNCSVHEAFDSWPADFLVLAIAHDNSGIYTADDGTVGTPYIMARGEGLEPILADPNIKWLQPPDETPTGMDIRIDRGADGIPRVVADDFPCTTTGPITDVHFWGSWRRDIKGNLTKIHVSIHKDIPADQNDPGSFSKPGVLLWEMDFLPGDFNETFYLQLSPDDAYEWWWDPFDAATPPDPNGDQQIWQYDIYIDPNDTFIQEGSASDPLVYWLDIYVVTDSADTQFGWKTSSEHWNDDAVYWNAGGGSAPGWAELLYPPGHPYEPNSIDMAFMITTEPEVVPTEACCFPDGNCVDLTVAECIENGGTPQGTGTGCAATDCPTPGVTEACCLPDGNCADLTLAECKDRGGTPQGSGTDCNDVNCPVPCEIPPVNCPSGDEPVVMTAWAGFHDNFAPPPELTSPSPMLLTYITTCSAPGVPLQFDEVPGEGGVPANSWLGHTFTGLPSGIIAARLEIRARATTGSGSGGTWNDHISIVDSITGCTPTWAWSNRFENLPEAGGDWLPGEVATFCLDLAALPTKGGPVSVLSQLATGSLSIRIDDDTGTDYITLTIAVCPCEHSFEFEALAGIDDDCEFTPPLEPASPSTEMTTAFPGAWRRFDQIVSNRRFGHTFTALRCCPVAAELEICMRAGWDIPSNDALSLEFLNPTFAWSKRIKDLPLTPGGTPIGSWNAGDVATFTLDLGDLVPSNAGVTSVLRDMCDGDLDVYVQDDTAVDYMILRYWCCCKETIPGDTNLDWIVNWKDIAIAALHWLEFGP